MLPGVIVWLILFKLSSDLGCGEDLVWIGGFRYSWQLFMFVIHFVLFVNDCSGIVTWNGIQKRFCLVKLFLRTRQINNKKFIFTSDTWLLKNIFCLCFIVQKRLKIHFRCFSFLLVNKTKLNLSLSLPQYSQGEEKNDLKCKYIQAINIIFCSSDRWQADSKFSCSIRCVSWNRLFALFFRRK